MIKYLYRPHKGTLKRAMEESVIFSNIEDVKIHVVRKSNIFFEDSVTVEDIIIGGAIGDDKRIKCKNVRPILAKSFGGEVYEHPICVGHVCEIE